MELSDIVQIALLSGMFFFIFGYITKSRLPFWIKSLQNMVLKPRYLKSAGFLFGGNHSSKVHKEP